MTANQTLIQEKLNSYFSTIFEKKLIKEIINIGVFKTIKTGDSLINIGDQMTHIPLILNGVIKIIRENDHGDEIALYFLGEGDTCAISIMNCINKKDSIFKCIAEKDSEIILIPFENVLKWFKLFDTWSYFILNSYHERLYEMVDSIDGLAFTKLDERLQKYLTETVKVMESHELNITHQKIADDLNTSRVVISRLLKQFEHEGKIELLRNKLIVKVFN
ncbi:Crp/Fnr family transcriptional regulator [Lutibacter sp. B1]|uniref:Crp/Fnr family transcriptional regulator n=1 Tax=Lutibacter sp. B1 TaxID=2725996 RepID=UPI0014565D3F|nr:Crp/Fnr family transcriptional regulator [Lutibacter sp. B1]NLP58222.1 Crp/Fnr family transcriptional regulator [Lutibacter sp. B1]